MVNESTGGAICFACQRPGATTGGPKGERYHERCLPEPVQVTPTESQPLRCPNCSLSIATDDFDTTTGNLNFCPQCGHSISDTAKQVGSTS